MIPMARVALAVLACSVSASAETRADLILHGGRVHTMDRDRDADAEGTITEGKLADLVVLSQDILAAAPEQIRRTKVDYTILGGRIVHQR